MQPEVGTYDRATIVNATHHLDEDLNWRILTEL